MGFPLYAHAAGVWAKTIRGRTHYFGPWNDPEEALQKYFREKDHLFAGEPPPDEQDGMTLDELVNRFLIAQRDRLDDGEIGQLQFADYKRDGERILDVLGRTRPADLLRPEDFARLRRALAKGRNATTIMNIIVRVRTIFGWADRTRLLASPPHYGGQLSTPSARARRRALRANGPRDLTAAQIRTLLTAAEQSTYGGLLNLHAMILLGINAGLGNTDCAELRTSHLDLDAATLDFPRPKTEADRRAVLWPETVTALAAAIERAEKMEDAPEQFADRVFLTKRRMPYVHLSPAGKGVNAVGNEFGRLLRNCKLHRPGLGFYALRRTFRTVADATLDFPAIDLVMGHLPDDGAPFAARMGARYRERIDDDRLRTVAEHVRTWLFDAANPKADTVGSSPAGGLACPLDANQH